jgi:tetratricopeptide (TPR) repeat protein
MSARRIVPLTAILLLIALSPALASFGGKSDPPQASSPEPPRETLTPRQQAMVSYSEAYDEIARAKKDLDLGKAKNAEKKFRRALERGLQATELDSTYHEAWNLVGYASRQLREYDRALAAYGKCLRLAPDYAPAIEYLGQAYLELGQPDRARQQLAALERLKAVDEIKTLSAAIDAWQRAQPATTGAAEGAGK